jgi:ubiquinone/menaquinone biosynthesis C-methylase UbiE
MRRKENVMKKLAKKDRFTKLTMNYGELFGEVFAAAGLSYEEYEKTILKAVQMHCYTVKFIPILDIGIGDGETSKHLVRAGFTNITGIDKNEDMLKAAKKKLGSFVKLKKMDACKMKKFNPHQFMVIVSASVIHNISKKKRTEFWEELRRLDPKLFV